MPLRSSVVIGSLRGVVLDRTPRSGAVVEVLVEVGGVGYRALMAAGAAAQSAAPGAPTFLHIHTHVREDAIILYGFPSRDELACFEALIGAHGVGPAVALALLSVHSPAALQRAVLAEDVDALMLVPGIGKKTAVRLLVELKARLDVEFSELRVVGAGRSAGGVAEVRAEVRTALAALGYGPEEIRQALVRLPDDGAVEDQVRAALRELAAVR